jgi:hypothetical protein
MDELEDRATLAQRIHALIRRDAEHRTAATRLIIGIMVLGGAFVVAAAQFMPEPRAHEIAWKPAVGVLGAVMAALGGFWSLLAESTTPEALDNARRALDREAELDRQIREFEDHFAILDERLDLITKLYVTTRALMEAAERSIVLGQSIEDALQHVLDNIGSPLTELIGFEAGENWGLSIYEARVNAEDGKRYLHCIATYRADRISEKKAHRVWPEGYGTVGHAQSSGLEVVVPDMGQREQTYWIPMTAQLTHPNDSQRFRSIAAVPVRVSNLDAPWGVVAGSSKVPDRFSRDGNGHQSVEPLRALAAMVALLVAHAYVSPKGER